MRRFALLAVALPAVSLLTAAPTHGCSRSQFSGLLRDSEVYFLGTATADTLLAGPGGVRYRTGGEHSEEATGGPIYGQVVRVDRLGGRAAEQLPENVSEVVVVPWGVDSMCRPMPWWGRSAQWVTPGTPGLYVATLRAPEHWVDGRPTVDVRNTGEIPYTANADRIRGMGPGDSADALLSPEQLFEVYRVLPTASDVATRGPAVLEPLRAWARQHPEVVTGMPAKPLLSTVTEAVANQMHHAELRRTDHPVLGTWRFTFRMPGGASRVFFARTGAYPTRRWARSFPRTDDPLELRVSPAEGYSFLTATARTLEELPATPEQAYRHGSGYLYASAHADSRGDGSTGWRGYLDVGLLRGVISDSRIREVGEESFRRGVYRLQEGLPVETPARFTTGADGILRVIQSFPLSGGEAFVLEGEQLSGEVIGSR